VVSVEKLELSEPAIDLVPSYLAFLDEMAAIGERVWPPRPEPTETAEGFVARLRRGVAPPQTTYWGAIGETVVGRIVLRHHLTAELAEYGGHVSYDVRPSHRKRGLATEMLRHLLRTAKAKEIGNVLLTCAPDNVASNRTILANGGVLERTVFVERIARATNLYWIAVQ
jgi:predicted acetyltransferase